MNVPTDHTAAAAVTRERGNLVLKFPDEAYGLFDASFDRLAEGKIFFAAKRAKPVIGNVLGRFPKYTLPLS